MNQKTQNFDSHIPLGNLMIKSPQNDLYPDSKLHTMHLHLLQLHLLHHFGVEEELSDLHSLGINLGTNGCLN